MAAGVEFVDLDWIALLAGMIASIALGFLWYSPKLPTGKIWMRDMKLPLDHKPTSKQMATGMTLMVVGTFLLMFVLMHVFVAFRDAYRLDGERLDGMTMVDGLMGAFFTWLGFFVPVGFSSVAWESRPWSLFFVNTSYHLVNLIVAGLIFASMM